LKRQYGRVTNDEYSCGLQSHASLFYEPVGNRIVNDSDPKLGLNCKFF